MNPIIEQMLKSLVNELPTIIAWLLEHYHDDTCKELEKHGFKKGDNDD